VVRNRDEKGSEPEAESSKLKGGSVKKRNGGNMEVEKVETEVGSRNAEDEKKEVEKMRKYEEG